MIDRHARTAGPIRTRRAKDVFAGDLAPTSWLGELVADARAHAAEYVDAFLRGFGDAVSKDSAAELRRWAGDGVPADEVPGLERAVQTAVVAWNEEGAELAARIALLEDEIARMEAKPSLDEAGERDLKRLRGELGAARRTRSERERAYWISALEATGLLPNYALLDDTTRLDVGLWWTDEETGEHKATDEQYVRGSRTALAELAPGATFYVRGTSVEIDGVDLGTTRNPATVTRRFCPACGWSERVGPDSTATACRRCHAPGAADSGQVFTTLPFRRASAYASRELAMRDDDSDERRRTRFTVLTTVETRAGDIVGTAWELDGYPFGAEVLRTADIRWLNLGPSERGGPTWMIAGQEVATPLFDTCRHCGIVPLAQRGVRERAEARHRGWCRQRREPDPDGWISLALTHELRTQAVRLLVPPIALVDRTVRASFRAALLLGLRQVLGGDPDHLDVVEATDPAQGSERWVMVLHDLVPGGTGYLARFVDPDRVRELLEQALTVLRECPCREEGVAACHRCLLPHVAPHQAGEVRRTVAIDLLEEVLAHWEPRPIDTISRIKPDLHDTPIEKRFRTLLLRWAKARGAALTVTATAHGDSATIHFPSALGDGRWQLVPQVKLGGVHARLRADQRGHAGAEDRGLLRQQALALLSGGEPARRRRRQAHGAARPGLPGVGGDAPRPRRLRGGARRQADPTAVVARRCAADDVRTGGPEGRGAGQREGRRPARRRGLAADRVPASAVPRGLAEPGARARPGPVPSGHRPADRPVRGGGAAARRVR